MSFASPVLAVVIFGATTSSARPSRDLPAAKPSVFVPAADSLFSRRFRRGGPKTAEQPQQPTAKPGVRAVDVFLYAPFSPAEERKTRSPRAELASRTDSRRLFEQSVAARVRRGASGLSTAGNPSKARAGRSGGALWLLSGGPESDSPAGAKSRHGPRPKDKATRNRGVPRT